MIETYRPSGRFKIGILMLVPAAMLVMVVAGFVYFLALKWIPFIYISFLVTLGLGGIAGFIGGTAVKLGHCRNTALAVLVGVLLGATGLLAKFVFQHRDYSATIAEAIVQEQGLNLDDAQQLTANGFTFAEFIKLRADEGWEIGRGGRDGMPIKGLFVYLVWAIEAGAILYLAVPAPRDAARTPYHETLAVWASEEEDLATMPVLPEVANRVKQTTELDALLVPPKPTDNPEGQFLHYSVNSIPGEEMEAAYLSIKHVEVTVNKKGEQSTKTKDLWNYVALTPEQRELITRNLQNPPVELDSVSGTESTDSDSPAGS